MDRKQSAAALPQNGVQCRVRLLPAGGRFHPAAWKRDDQDGYQGVYAVERGAVAVHPFVAGNQARAGAA